MTTYKADILNHLNILNKLHKQIPDQLNYLNIPNNWHKEIPDQPNHLNILNMSHKEMQRPVQPVKKVTDTDRLKR